MPPAWQPEATGLAHLLDCLAKSEPGSASSQQQREVTETLDAFNRNVPDYSCYLAHILCFLTNQDGRVRCLAGIILKNNVRQLGFGPESGVAASILSYVKAAIMESSVLSDPIQSVRNTAGTVVSMIALQYGPESWPEALQHLIELTDSPDRFAKHGAFQTLGKICEDVPRKLETMVINGYRVLDILVPRIIHHLRTTNDPKIRIFSLNCLNPFIQSRPEGSLKPHLKEFVQGLFQCASDADPEVRKSVCIALVGLLSESPDVLLPELSATVDYMLYSTQDEDEGVALEACEFWLTFGEESRLKDHLNPYLPKIVPVLLKGMVYSENELLTLDHTEDDAAIPDRDQDIKPRFYGGRDRAVHSESSQQKDSTQHNGDDPTHEEDDDDDDDDDSDAEDLYSEWNLRKCSAAALDVIAVAFQDNLLPHLLPALKEHLFDPLWTHKEAGILALGAIAEGCANGMKPHLPTLIPLLLECLNDRKALVRSIGCWTLGRYAAWIVSASSPTEDRKSTVFLPVMECLLTRVLDSNKRVQEAACSAFATLEEEAGEELEPYLFPILNGLVQAFHRYQQKNLLILYDALGTLADAVGIGLAKPDLLNVLMPPLIGKWQNLADQDNDLIPLLECLSSIAIAIGPSFTPYAQPVFERCVRIINSSLEQYGMYVQNPTHFEAPDKTFLIVALDLLSAITQGLGPQSVALYQASSPPVLPLLGQCLSGQFPESAVRQSAFALVGDCAISCYQLLEAYLPEYMPQIIAQIDADGQAGLTSVCNNAAWAAGEIAVKGGARISEFVDPLMSRLLPVLIGEGTARSLKENSAVTIGRLALACPQRIAPSLPMFIRPWCQALAEIRDNEEKDSAFKGICMAIESNPSSLNDNFIYWLNAVGRWDRPSPDLLHRFRSLLNNFRAVLGDQRWEASLGALTPQTAQRILVFCGAA